MITWKTLDGLPCSERGTSSDRASTSDRASAVSRLSSGAFRLTGTLSPDGLRVRATGRFSAVMRTVYAPVGYAGRYDRDLHEREAAGWRREWLGGHRVPARPRRQ